MKTVPVKKGPLIGENVEVLKKFTSMLKGLQVLVKLDNGKEQWINATDLED